MQPSDLETADTQPAPAPEDTWWENETARLFDDEDLVDSELLADFDASARTSGGTL